jgi:ABC-type lipoprotein export system ATPase subunit
VSARSNTAITRDDSAPILQARGVSKSFRRGPEEVRAVRRVSLVLRRGEVLALVGPSGSGKTTLLNVLCGWESLDAGEIVWRGAAVSSPLDLTWSEIAFVPQDLGLMEEFSLRANVELPFRLSGRLGPEQRTAVADLLSRFGLEDDLDRLPVETSLGEQQRAALARALIVGPGLLLADEPTAHQDSSWAAAVMEHIRAVASDGMACVIATHDPSVLDAVDSVISMHDGSLHRGR